MFHLQCFLRLAVCAVMGAAVAVAQPEARTLFRAMAAKAQEAKAYSFDGKLEVIGQRGSAPGKVLVRAKVRCASAGEGKSFLSVESEGRDEYLLISDGQKMWAYVPKLKQYTEQEGAILANSESDADDEPGGAGEEKDLAAKFARMVIPALASGAERLAAADINGTEEVRFMGRTQALPLYRAMSSAGEDNSRSLLQLVVDPQTGNIVRLKQNNVWGEGENKTIIQLTVDFSNFSLDAPVPDELFRFNPPKKAKLVEALPLPGQTGSFLLNRPAPDFELKTLEGEKVRISALRGKPVLLSFWASWCGPCRRELPALTRIHTQYKDRGLVVLGVNDEGKSTARKFADLAEISFPTLDDSDLRAHRLYRVSSIPSLFLINDEGKVVRYFQGAHDEKDLKTALKSVGF